jgi:hypothetical protein
MDGVLAGARRGLLGGFELGTEFGEVAGDKRVRAGSGLDPAGDVTPAAGHWFQLDPVAGEVQPYGVQVSSLSWCGRPF